MRVAVGLVCGVLGLAATSLGGPQRPAQKGGCPWCEDDLAHGPIAIGPKGSAALAESLPSADWKFLETPHLRWAFALGPETVDMADRKRVRAEIARLKLLLPSVPDDPKKLDPWLRLHLLAMKGEELYARFQELLQVTDDDFPETRAPDGPFMGAGKYLGELEKFEVVLHPSRELHRTFTTDLCGVSVTDSFRWHFKVEHKMLVSIPAEDPDLRRDRWLFPHVAHNLSHAFLCAYKHFSYDPPIWIDEGLAHAIEKEIEPESVTTDGTEGASRETHMPSDWDAAVRKLVAAKKAATLAELMHAKEFGELDADRHLVAWSMVRFLIEEHPDALAQLLGGIKGQLDEEGRPSSRDLTGLQRRLLLGAGNWTPAGFDEAWRAWALRRETPKSR